MQAQMCLRVRQVLDQAKGPVGFSVDAKEEEEEVSFSRDCDNLSLYSPLLEFLLTSQYFRHYARPHKSLISDWWIQINCYWQAIRTVNQKLWVVLFRTRWYRMKPCPSRLPHGTLYFLSRPRESSTSWGYPGEAWTKSTTSCKRMV